jgi:hypothetical protein
MAQLTLGLWASRCDGAELASRQYPRLAPHPLTQTPATQDAGHIAKVLILSTLRK